MKNLTATTSIESPLYLEKAGETHSLTAEFPDPVHHTLFQYSSPLAKSLNQLLKRSFDIVVSLIIIIGILTWLAPLIAIAIKLGSKGPVFFLQKRNKKGGRVFTCI